MNDSFGPSLSGRGGKGKGGKGGGWGRRPEGDEAPKSRDEAQKAAGPFKMYPVCACVCVYTCFGGHWYGGGLCCPSVAALCRNIHTRGFTQLGCGLPFRGGSTEIKMGQPDEARMDQNKLAT